MTIDGAGFGLVLSAPFAGMLLSIAALPLAAPKLWHRHQGKIAFAWAVVALAALTVVHGAATAWHLGWHALLLEYMPFVVFIATLYIVAGGIHLSGNLRGTPIVNTSLLAVGALLASLMGTTGAAMLLIRPLIRANDHRLHRVHTVVFFIFIVANIGGALTPLGDPPLFLGFLKGVDFFWTTQHMLVPTGFLVAVLLAVFFVVDTVLLKRDIGAGSSRGEPTGIVPDPTPPEADRFGLHGWVNVALLAIVVAIIVLSGLWRTDLGFDLFGTVLPAPDAVRCALFVVVSLASLAWTPKTLRETNQYSWEPVLEVAKLFFGIFITMAPVLLMLKAGSHGAFAPLVGLVNDANGHPNEPMLFWLTGTLSALLDNAPTYLAFFNLVGGDPQELMTRLAPTLVAISAGAVYMGALSYIGNAPNFMVKAIAESRGIAMPSFFGYLAWSCTVLLPVFALMTWLFFV